MSTTGNYSALTELYKIHSGRHTSFQKFCEIMPKIGKNVIEMSFTRASDDLNSKQGVGKTFNNIK